MTLDNLSSPVAAEPVYPIRLEILRPERQRKLTNLPLGFGTLIRLTLLLPSVLLLYLFLSLAPYLYVAATFVILFRGRYPTGAFKMLVGSLRWTANVSAYLLHLFDEYPPIDLDQRPESRLQLSVEYPQHPSRLLNSPVLGLTIKLILCIPHFLVLIALYFIAGVVVFIGSFAILFSGSFPAGMYEMVVGTQRWNARVYGYLYGFTDRYPPFSLS